jgi:hypothetical protein
VAIKHLLVLDHSGEEIYQTNIYLHGLYYTFRIGPPLVGCPRLLIQYICSFPPKLDGISSIRNLRTSHAVVIVTHLTWMNAASCVIII